MALLAPFRVKLAVLLTIVRFRARMLRYSLTAMPIAGAQDDDDADDSAADDSSADDNDDSADDADDDSDSDDDDADDKKPAAKQEPNWKQMARKHEREAKKLRKQAEDAAKRLKDRDDADKSEQEKALDEARKEAVKDLKAEHEKERRQDRLESRTTVIAAKGLKVGDDDDAKTLKFADPDDAMIYLERAIKKGDVDEEDLFGSDGRVDSKALEEALTDILASKPHLASEGKVRKVKGSADAGKGSGASGEPTVADELKKIRRNREGASAGATHQRVA